MRVDFGRTDVPTAGTAVRLNDIAEGMTFLSVKNPPTNNANVFVGLSNVSSVIGRTLEVNETLELDFDPQGKGTSILANLIFVDVTTSGHDVEWIMIFK